MLKKIFSLFVIGITLVLIVGCSSTSEKTGESKKPIKITYIAMKQTSPQALINQKDNTIVDQLKKAGITATINSTRSLDNIWPMMDSKTNAPDFVYIPAGNFGTYVTKTSRFGGSDNYSIIAGSSNSNGTVLIARPGINSLQDLAGKKVAIANLRYLDEFQLNKVLSKAGLSTDSMGGTVKIVWADIVADELNGFAQGTYDAVVVYDPENFPIALAKVQGSKIITSLNPNGLFGDKAPRVWLVAKRELIKDNPKLVKEVLKAHLAANDKAIAEKDSLAAINRDIYLKYYQDNKVNINQMLEANTLEKYKTMWKNADITYDPNVAYTKDVYDYLNKKGLVKSYSFKDFVQVELLKETLKELGKDPIK